VAQKVDELKAKKPRLAEHVSVLSVAPLLVQEMERQQAQTTGFTGRIETVGKRQVGG